ncbi:MAG TPA: DUF4325 domain-containing protein [Deltaproteobacteria bacterium]|jgi:hypothetical protein|nr:DUF4325 domain-containing protein [Deltaproteobacteria bacterium]
MERDTTKQIHEFILANVEAYSSNISAKTSEKFGISRQAANRHTQHLVQSGMLEVSGNRRNRKYTPKSLREEVLSFELKPSLAEDRIWVKHIRPIVAPFIGANANDILNYGFSEIFNNAIDHSEGSMVDVIICIFWKKVRLTIRDNGTGIFDKIQRYFMLDDPRHALLELAKGKLTSDPERHTGEGIFFTCRMFDWFSIRSRFLSFIRYGDDDWLLEDRKKELEGTSVTMEISRDTERTSREVFEKYAGEANDYGFTRTHVPVNLALYEGETLVSRSQAKRLLARVDRFREVLLDFKDVKDIGAAFADEIFRVFAKAHPSIKLLWINADPLVEKMIARAKGKGNDAPIVS